MILSIFPVILKRIPQRYPVNKMRRKKRLFPLFVLDVQDL